MIQTDYCARLRDRRGLAAVHYILMVLIALVLLMFVVDGYMRHLQDIAMTYDCEEVDEAVACAKTQYLMDGAPGAVVYYYDAETKQVYTRDHFPAKNRVDLKGYGRSLEFQNRQAQTGATGVPNRGDECYRKAIGRLDDGTTTTSNDVTHNRSFFDNIRQNVTGLGDPDGAQFLAISFSQDGQLTLVRWRGPVLYYYDYTMMSAEEKAALTDEERERIAEDAPEGETLFWNSQY